MTRDFDELRDRLTRLLDQVREHGFDGANAERLSERAYDVLEALESAEDTDPELFAANLDLRELAREAYRRVQIHQDTARVDELLEQTSTDNPDPAWTALDALARLPKDQQPQYVQRFKSRAGRSLHLHDYRAALREKAVEADRAFLHGLRDGRPSVVVGDVQFRELADECLRVLLEANDPPRVFQRAGELVEVRHDEHGRPRIVSMGEAHLRGRLCRIANFVRQSKNGAVHALPPREVLADLQQRGDWNVPPLKGVVEAPYLTTSGEIVDRPGYNAETALILAPSPGLAVPEIPTRPSASDVADARALIDDVLADFPFVDAASYANAFGCLLTPVLRPALDGNVPLALFDATKPGTGKGLLASVVAIVATGQHDAELTVPPKSDDEWRKKLLSIFARGRSLVVIDEADELRSPALASTLTHGYITDRVLGKSEELTVEQRATWIACGNNVQPRGDLVRRTYLVALDANTSRPHERTGFRHADLRKHARERRSDLLAAALTLARAWYADDCPSADVPPFGSFEAWASTVGGVLAHAGVDGFLSNLRQSHVEKNDDDAEWERFLRALLAYYGEAAFSTRDVEYAIAEHAVGTLIEAVPGELSIALASPSKSHSTKGSRERSRAGTQARRSDARCRRSTASPVAKGAGGRTARRRRRSTEERRHEGEVVSKARKKLDAIERKLAEIPAKERDLTTRYAEAKRLVEELHGQLSDAIESGAIGTDGSTTDVDVQKLHAEIAVAQTAVESGRWHAEREGLHRARQKLEAERLAIVRDNFDELATELVEASASARKLLDDAIASVEKASAAWSSIAAAWLALERAAELGRSPSTRLDVPAFPISLTGDLDAQPIPFTLAQAATA